MENKTQHQNEARITTNILFLFVGVAIVLFAFAVMLNVFEWVRANAQADCSPIAILAWIGCIFSASFISGNLGLRLYKHAGIVFATVMLFFSVLGILLSLDYFLGYIIDGLGTWGITGLIWSITVGLATGYVSGLSVTGDGRVWPVVAVTVIALVTLLIIMGPIDQYFIKTWVNQ